MVSPNYDPTYDDEDDKFTSPDASQLKYCADMLSSGRIPKSCNSSWESCGYKEYSSVSARSEHDYIVKEVYKLINGK